MSKKNKKGVKMALSDFLSDHNTGSWADEMADLPTAPAAAIVPEQTRAPRESGFSRSEPTVRPRNTDVELPTNPPFTAFFGNLSFSVSEPQIEQFFSNQKVANVRLVKGMDGRSKGFAYVEFADIESLKSALDLHGNQLEGRPVSVDVAEQRPQREDKTSGVWRRDGPARPREEPKAFESADTWRTGAPRATGARPTGGFERRDPPSERQNSGGRYASGPKPVSVADEANTWRRPDSGAPRTTSAFKDSWRSKDFESKREDGERREYTPRAPREPREPREPRAPKPSESEGSWRRA